jgi:putative phage-type endonuclease
VAIEILADLTDLKSEDEEYQRLRKLGIGGSDAGAVVGVSKWRTPYQVWAEKVNPSETAHRESEAMTWGKLLEAPIRNEFSERTGIEVHPLPKMIRNTDYPWMLASVDGVTGPSNKLTGVYEGKTTRFADNWPKDDDGTVQVPLEYVVQGMHYLAVLELERVHYACLIGGQELRIAEVEVNPTLIADLIEIEEAFWRKVIEREPPPVNAGDVPLLKKRWQPEAGKSIELPATSIPALKVRAQRKVQIKALEADVDQIDAEIMALMGDAEEATVANKGVVATWKPSTRSTPDWDEIGRMTHRTAEAAKAEFSTITTGRRFLPKEIKE